MKNQVVVFGDLIPRIITTDDVDSVVRTLQAKNIHTYAVNPDLGVVRHLAVEYWKLSDEGKVVPMDRKEAALKHAYLLKNNIIPRPHFDILEYLKEEEDRAKKLEKWFFFLGGNALGAALYALASYL